MEKFVVVVNGKGEAGKDTLCDITGKYYRTRNVSSIDPIKKIASENGWDGAKDSRSRKFLADLKSLFAAYNDLPTRYLTEQYQQFLASDAEIMFVHIREPEEIEKFINSVGKTPCVSLLVRREQANVSWWGNEADDNVEQFSYDYYYNNILPIEAVEQDFMVFFDRMAREAISKEDGGGNGMMKEEVLAKFKELYGDEGEIGVYFAPGRVNLIGEHTDYNGGHVFPCALTIGTYGAVRKRNDRKLRFYSMNFSDRGIIESSLDDLNPQKEAGWTNYPKGVMWAFEKRGMKVQQGMDFVLYGNIPNGSGLSSSASVEVLTGYILKDLFGFEVSNQDLALIGQYSENNFNGVNCGIMDQFAIAMGKENQAIFLDTATLHFEYAPIVLKGAKIVISCSNKKRGLGDSKYNERRSECESALAQIGEAIGINTLGDLNEEQFEQYKDAIKDEICRKRAKHAVYENQRTIRAVAALKGNNLELFGKLMNESHVSLRDDYEVTGVELDTLVEEAWNIDGVIGSRMTGAGFGGCTVSIVKDEAVDTFIEKVGAAYREKIGYAADFYVVEIGDGPQKI